MGCKELDKDRGVLSRACYFTGDLEDCETKNNKIQWIQRGTWSSIVPKRTSLVVDRAHPYSTWQDSGDLELLQKHISQLGLLPGTKPSRYRAIHSTDTQKKRNQLHHQETRKSHRLAEGVLHPTPPETCSLSLPAAGHATKKKKKEETKYMLKNSRLLPLPKRMPKTIPLPSIPDVLPGPFSLPWPLSAAAGCSSHTAPPQTPAPKTPG